ncbi:MAG: thioredoxin [Ruminococcus sp.]|nr:thioredoxin [Ruminococcus sp.]
MVLVKSVNSNNFGAEVLQNKKPTFVDFYADWCGPCNMLAPVIDKLSKEPISKKSDFAKLNIEESEDIASLYGVMSVPTLILFKDGEEQVRMVGVHPKDAIAATIEDALS